MGPPAADPPEAPPPQPPARGAGRGGGAAALVAAGILLSRLSGLVRAKVLAYFLGLGDEKDALGAALRIPNLLQNRLGEGALSASFIPVYAGLRAAGDDEEADRVAGAVLALLALVTSGVVLLGVLFAPRVVTLLAGDYEGA